MRSGLFVVSLTVLQLFATGVQAAEPMYKVEDGFRLYAPEVCCPNEQAAFTANGESAYFFDDQLWVYDASGQETLHYQTPGDLPAEFANVAMGRNNDLYFVLWDGGNAVAIDADAAIPGDSGNPQSVIARMDRADGTLLDTSRLDFLPSTIGVLLQADDGSVVVANHSEYAPVHLLWLDENLKTLKAAFDSAADWRTLNDVALVPGSPNIAWVAGSSSDPAFASTDGTAIADNGEPHGVLLKIDLSTGSVLYATVLGTGWSIIGLHVIADSVYFAGNAQTADLPVTGDARQSELAGERDGFYGKMKQDGEIQHLSYFGGNSFDGFEHIRLDSSGRPVLAGLGYSGDLPASVPSFMDLPSSPGGLNSFVLVLSSDFQQVEFLTFIGGSMTWPPGWEPRTLPQALHVGSDDSLHLFLTTTTWDLPALRGPTPESAYQPGGILRLEKNGMWLQDLDVVMPAYVNSEYRHVLQADGGTPPYRYFLAAGHLPDGLEISAEGELRGTPTQTHPYTGDQYNWLTVGIEDANGGMAMDQKLLAVFPELQASFEQLEPCCGAGIYSGSDIEYRVSASGGYGEQPYAFALVEAPDGLGITWNSENPHEAIIDGTVSESGSYTIRVRVTDALGRSAVFEQSLTVQDPPAESPGDDSPESGSSGGGSLFWLLAGLVWARVRRVRQPGPLR